MFRHEVAGPWSDEHSLALRPTRPADPGLTCLVTIAAAAIVATPHVVQLRRDGFEAMLAQLHDCAVYSRVVIRVDYFHDGFVRGGLSGTLLALLPVSPQRQVLWFIAGSLVFLLVPLALLVRRVARTRQCQVDRDASAVTADRSRLVARPGAHGRLQFDEAESSPSQ